ncbi:MAG: ComF family protein [Ignavibacteriales bacterium]|nr:ComF family protein [Ignavibacteriales bacterium]
MGNYLINITAKLNPLFDFILPRFCSSCKEKLKVDEKVICRNCFSTIQIASTERIQHEFERKFIKEKIISGFYSHFVFEKDKALQNLIHSLKYEKKFKNGIFLGEIVGNEVKDKLKDWKIDYLIPVPLHSIKKAERGYNQSFFIAKGISRQTGIPVKQNLLKRSRNTGSQTTMTLIERKENVGGAFTIKRKTNVANKNFLLIDDVITTGATTAECGKVLLESGASKIYAVSVAIAD